jgi:hypothetical protein
MYSEPEYAKLEKKNTDYPFYSPSIGKYLLPEVRAIIVSFCHAMVTVLISIIKLSISSKATAKCRGSSNPNMCTK